MSLTPSKWWRRPKAEPKPTLDTPTLATYMEGLRRAYLIVRTGGEWVAYGRGRRGTWDEWRAIQMLGGLDSPRVGTRPTTKTRVPADVPHPRTLKVERETPDTFPEEWCND